MSKAMIRLLVVGAFKTALTVLRETVKNPDKKVKMADVFKLSAKSARQYADAVDESFAD